MVDMALLSYLETFLSDERKARFTEVLSQRTTFLTVVLEDIFQMHNASAVLRSCEIFGLQEVHFVEGRFGKKMDRNIAMGAQKWVDVCRYGTIEQCIERLRQKGYCIVAATPGTGGCALDQFVPQAKTAILFGTEKEGLSREAILGTDSLITIPMTGFTESLNVSVSVGICLYALSAGLRSSDLDWRLTEEEVLVKRMDWAKKSIKSHQKIVERFYGKK